MFFNVNLIDNHRMCNTFTLRNEEGLSFVEESQDRMKLRTIKMIYYFLNCHKGMDDSKIKVMIEKDGVIQMLEKRVETISDDGWKKIIEDFRKLHENEERMELQLELEEAQKEVKELNQERVLMVQMMLKNGMSVSQIAKSVSKSEEEIMKWIS